MSKKYVIALYLRLSLEDDGSGESESIGNQRNMLNHYISNQADFTDSEFADIEVLEFVDDGYSGTNFNRPAVKEMLDKVKNGEINCIVVKDFSRFGRNHIEVGDYIEQIFPFLGVRFISVNNNFDSKNYSMQAGTLDMAFSNLINDYYSKDVSRKVTSAKQAKMRNGDYMSTSALYGYRKMASNKNRLEIDPVAVEYVRKVFSLCLEGKSTGAIAQALNSQGIPTPLAYKRSIGYNRKWNIVNDTNHWTRAMVWKILRDERYIGATISGKTKVMRVGSNHRLKQPKSEWIVVHGTHEPIISKEVFDEAQAIMGIKKERSAHGTKERLFLGKVKCGNCGHTMRGRYDKEKPYFFCETVKVHKSECVAEKVFEDTLSDIILASIRKYAEIALCAESILFQKKSKTDGRIAQLSDDIVALHTEIDKAKTAKIALYESYKEGKLTKDMYLDERNGNDEAVVKATKEIERISREMEALRGDLCDNQFVDSLKNSEEVFELTPKLVHELVAAIKIHDIDTIEIMWNFEDDYQRVLRMLGSLVTKT